MQKQQLIHKYDEVRTSFSGLQGFARMLRYTDVDISCGEFGVILSCFVERLDGQLTELERQL